MTSRLWICSTLLILCGYVALAQDARRYRGRDGKWNLCGPFALETLQTDAAFQAWFNEPYAAFELHTEDRSWKERLEDVTVEIYMGTWCPDSRAWAPRFVKLWDELGLKRTQLTLIALYDADSEGNYKRGPDGEGKDKGIHHIPTFVFERHGQEIGRIVESPKNDLETDVAQLALGYPSTPNYQAADYMVGLLKTTPKEAIRANMAQFAKNASTAKNPYELNTLAQIYLSSGQTEEALLTLRFNTLLYPKDPYAYRQYADALAEAGQPKEAITYYKKALRLAPHNSDIKKRLKRLKRRR